LEDIEPVEGGRPDSDQHLTGPRVRIRDINHLQDINPAEPAM
jgi:hypothetical protein